MAAAIRRLGCAWLVTRSPLAAPRARCARTARSSASTVRRVLARGSHPSARPCRARAVATAQGCAGVVAPAMRVVPEGWPARTAQQRVRGAQPESARDHHPRVAPRTVTVAATLPVPAARAPPMASAAATVSSARTAPAPGCSARFREDIAPSSPAAVRQRVPTAVATRRVGVGMAAVIRRVAARGEPAATAPAAVKPAHPRASATTARTAARTTAPAAARPTVSAVPARAIRPVVSSVVCARTARTLRRPVRGRCVRTARPVLLPIRAAAPTRPPPLRSAPTHARQMI